MFLIAAPRFQRRNFHDCGINGIGGWIIKSPSCRTGRELPRPPFSRRSGALRRSGGRFSGAAAAAGILV